MNERELILTSMLKCRRVDIYTDPPRLTVFQQKLFQEILKRRQEGEPLQYLLGEAEFSGLVFEVNPDVLIPRPETELLVQAILFLFRKHRGLLRIADLGTGSGNIAVSLAKHLPQTEVSAVDISAGALAVARKNARRHEVSENIDFNRKDIFKFFDDIDTQERYDLIISNPPYISKEGMRQLPIDVCHEPAVALYGGENGLEFYRAIIRGAVLSLKQDGILALEIGEDQREAIGELFREQGNHFFVNFIKDLAGKDRIVVAQKVPMTKTAEIRNLENHLKQ